MKKIIIPLILLGVFILFFVSSLFFPQIDHEKYDQVQIEYTFKTFPTSKEGWGYSIMKDGKEIIRQEQIPAIQGNSSFINESDASEVARLVIKKVKSGESPAVSRSELTALGILNN